jgi:hypothetical protein
MTLFPSCHVRTVSKGGSIRYPFESQTKLTDFDDTDIPNALS